MNALFNLIRKSENSKIHLWLLNRVINHTVRFNKPHGFKVIKITPEQALTFAPYHRKNFNHVRGIHACAIATAGELAAGLILMFHFSPEDYRLIMSHMEVNYHYQAKKNIIATATLPPAESADALASIINKTITTEVKDDDQKLIATVKTTWQIKKWSSVKTAL